jgi:hypothetical protein
LTEKHGDNENNVSPELMKQIVATMLRGLKDKVPNVRLTAARGLGYVTISGQCDDATMNTVVIPALSECITTDPDWDCKFQCELALSSKV